MKILPLFTVPLLLLGCAPRQTNNNITTSDLAQVQEVLNKQETTLNNMGYTKLDSRTGTLKQGESITIGMPIPAPEIRYVVSGNCDRQCNQLGLRVLNEKSEIITTPTTIDAAPISNFTSYRSGFYSIQLTMKSCLRPQGCVYGIMLGGSRIQ